MVSRTRAEGDGPVAIGERVRSHLRDTGKATPEAKWAGLGLVPRHMGRQQARKRVSYASDEADHELFVGQPERKRRTSERVCGRERHRPLLMLSNRLRLA